MLKSISDLLKKEPLNIQWVHKVRKKIRKRTNIKVVITTSDHPSLVPLIYQFGIGQTFGYDTRVIVALVEDPSKPLDPKALISQFSLAGLPSLHDIYATYDAKSALEDANFFIIIENEISKQLERFEQVVQHLVFLKPISDMLSVCSNLEKLRVIVVSNMPSLCSCILAILVPQLPKCNISGLTEHLVIRAAGSLAQKLKISLEQISGVILLGDSIPEVCNAEINFSPLLKPQQVVTEKIFAKLHPNLHKIFNSSNSFKKLPRAPSRNINFNQPLSSLFDDQEWAKTKLVEEAEAPVGPYPMARGLVSHLTSLWSGNSDLISMVLISDGSFGVPQGAYSSFPITINDHKIKIQSEMLVYRTNGERLVRHSKKLVQSVLAVGTAIKEVMIRFPEKWVSLHKTNDHLDSSWISKEEKVKDPCDDRLPEEGGDLGVGFLDVPEEGKTHQPSLSFLFDSYSSPFSPPEDNPISSVSSSSPPSHSPAASFPPTSSLPGSRAPDLSPIASSSHVPTRSTSVIRTVDHILSNNSMQKVKKISQERISPETSNRSLRTSSENLHLSQS